jgi:hypothetical protein
MSGLISVFGMELAAAAFLIPSPRASGERERERGTFNLASSYHPILHKAVEEKEKSSSIKTERHLA